MLKEHFLENTIHVFPTPITKINVSSIKSIISVFDALKNKIDINSPLNKDTVVGSHYYSDDNYVLNRDEFSDLKNYITEFATEFQRNVLGIEGQARVTQSWVNCNAPGQATLMHSHPNSVVSGVLYIDTDENNGIITFHRYAQDNGCSAWQLLPRFNEKLAINTGFANTTYNLKVRSGDFIMFPSFLLHSVPRNNTNKNRWCIAFNSVPTSMFGSQEGLTELFCGAK